MRPANNRRGQTDITHLMNFHIAPRHQQSYHPNRSYRRHGTTGSGSGYHPGDKSRFVSLKMRAMLTVKDMFMQITGLWWTLDSTIPRRASMPISIWIGSQFCKS
jgi:hypothetical protein